MIHKINNGNVYIAVNSKGAELCSLCDIHGTEYLWQTNSDAFGKYSPIIFPISLYKQDNTYLYMGKNFKMPKGGIVANSNFRVHEKYSDRLVLRLEQNLETYKHYPFNFCFDVCYELIENSLCIRFKVTNNDEKVMPYSIAVKPSFSLPIEDDEKIEDYYLKFDYCEICKTEQTDITQKTEGSQYLKFSSDTFNNGRLIFEDIKSRGAELLSINSGRGLGVNFEGFGNLAIDKTNKGKSIGLEPFTTLTSKGDEGILLEDENNIIMLPSGETAEHSYKITFI